MIRRLRGAAHRGAWAVAGRGMLVGALMTVGAQTASAQPRTGPGAPGVRLDAGRFTVVSASSDERLARTLLAAAQARDTFPGLPRPTARVLIAIAPDEARFRAWVGPHAPEWGAAIAFPDEQRVVMQGGRAGSTAGDPLVVLRHELAHLALHEHMGHLPSRWFDEGFASVAAGEWSRETAFETSLALVWKTLPPMAALDAGFFAGATQAEWTYALAHRVVAELEALDPKNGLRNLLAYWKASGSFEQGLRQAYGMTGEQFDKRWQQQTRRRYGALALVTNLSAVVGVFAIFLAPLFVSRRRRDKRRMEALRAADAVQEAAQRASALQALLDGASASDGIPTVESGETTGGLALPPPDEIAGAQGLSNTPLPLYRVP